MVNIQSISSEDLAPENGRTWFSIHPEGVGSLSVITKYIDLDRIHVWRLANMFIRSAEFFRIWDSAVLFERVSGITFQEKEITHFGQYYVVLPCQRLLAIRAYVNLASATSMFRIIWVEGGVYNQAIIILGHPCGNNIINVERYSAVSDCFVPNRL